MEGLLKHEIEEDMWMGKKKDMLHGKTHRRIYQLT